MSDIQFQIWLLRSPLVGERSFPAAAPVFEIFVRRKCLEATIKLSFKIVGKCSQWCVEIFNTCCFDAKSPDHCKFRWIECPIIVPWQRSEDGWGVLGFGWWRMIASRTAWCCQVQNLLATLDVLRSQHNKWHLHSKVYQSTLVRTLEAQRAKSLEPTVSRGWSLAQ